MEKTEFAGLTQLDPADSLAEDGYSFQSSNPRIIDFLLRVALTAHKHDAHVAMPNPTADPVVATLDIGGTIPSDLSITVGYTLIDAYGGESEINTTPQVITTQAGMATPTDAPTLVADALAGSLLAGSYSYALTVTDATGGETALGPASTVVVPSGSATNEIEVSGLDAIVTTAGGTGWRLWRSINGGQWSLINDGATPDVMDDGTLCADRGVEPPASTTGTTNATSRLQVTVPAAGQPADAVEFNIYASLDGTFATPALLGNYPVADFDAVKTYDNFAPLDGAPPARSLAVPGAPKINAATDILGLSWKGAVADAAALAAVTDMVTGDVRLQLSDMTLWGYDGAAWVGAGRGGSITRTAAVLAAGWSGAVNYWLDEEGAVHLEGTVHLTAAGAGAVPFNTTLLNLPADYRPLTDLHRHPVVTGAFPTLDAGPDVIGSISVDTAGDVKFRTGSASTQPFICLDGVIFQP